MITPPPPEPLLTSIRFTIARMTRLVRYPCPKCARPLAVQLQDRETTVVVPKHLWPSATLTPVDDEAERPGQDFCGAAGRAFEVPMTTRMERVS